MILLARGVPLEPMDVVLLRYTPPLPAAAASWRGHLLARLQSTFDNEPLPPPGGAGGAGGHARLLLTGPPGAGKASFLTRFTDNFFEGPFAFQPTTVGIDFRMRAVGLRGRPLRLQLWDTAGER